MSDMRVIAAEIFIRFSLIEIVWLEYGKGGLRHGARVYRMVSSGAADRDKLGSDYHWARSIRRPTTQAGVGRDTRHGTSATEGDAHGSRSTTSVFVVDPME